MIPGLTFPSIYKTSTGEEYILIGTDESGNIIGAKDFKHFDPETLRCIEDSKCDLMEKKNPMEFSFNETRKSF